MHIRQVLTFAIATAIGLAEAQTLRQAILEREELRDLLTLLDSRPELAANLSTLEGLTIFAPADGAQDWSVDRYDGGGWPRNFDEEFLYHVLDGWNVTSDHITEEPIFYPTLSRPYGLPARIEPGLNLTFASGTRLEVVLEDDNVVLIGSNRVNVVTADIPYDNGVIHIVDGLLFKPANPVNALLDPESTWAFSRAITNFTGLAPGFQEGIDGPGFLPFTIFAPNLSAFEALGASLNEDLALVPGPALSELSEEQFERIVEYHIVGAGMPFFSYNLFDGQELPVSSSNISETIRVTIDDDGQVFVNQARVLETNRLHENGVIHIIDSVLNPDQPELSPPGDDDDEPVVAEFEATAPADYVVPASRTVIEAQETAVATGGTEIASATTAPAWTAVPSTTATETAAPTSTAYEGAAQALGTDCFSLMLGSCAVALVVFV